ncbi:MAG: Gfo/Idh/MocA family oxidoreductase [Phycisphaerae bacterium]|nr:Gfo/Idh/MocA family oxidoreductase [Phycisphaerae bacterium]
MNIGVIGMGGLGTLHFKNLMKMPAVRVTGICDVRPERLTGDWAGTVTNLEQQRSENFDISAIAKFTDYRDLLKTDVQAVLIATPTFLHAEMAIAAMEAGKHVFCEKPMALNSADAARMAAVAKRCGRILQIGHVLRFWPEYIEAKAMIDDRRFGALRSVDCHRGGGFPGWAWENWFNRAELSGLAAVDLHIHDVDVIHWWLGMPTSVSSQGVWDGEGANEILTLYRGTAASLVQTHAYWVTGPCGFEMGFTLGFERATVVYGLGEKPGLTIFEKDAEASRFQSVAVGAGDGYFVEVEYFVDCVIHNKPNDRLPPDEVVGAMKIVEAELRSSKSGQWDNVAV